MPETLIETARAKIHAVWGYTQFRPLQKEAISAALQGRDSLVVLPTGGGKSLCYQAPALLSDRLTVVLSPLISLMKDQVDRLLSHGIQAAFLNSSLDFSDQRRVRQGVAQGKYQLLFVAPERMQDEGFVKLLDSANVGLFAIDEAHCISHWGHDFREDYRHLDQLKKRFPDASVHAFTATATPRVRSDILQQLGLTNPEVLVGDFFRSNLQYQVSPRTNIHDDIRKELDKRPGQTGIIYCIRRADVDELTAYVKSIGIRAAPYHAGMRDEDRIRVQDRFASDQLDVVVATVAFGMGIDRSDIRFVIHAGMPKSLEHYQQETGRAGRDGEPADCILFISRADFFKWRGILKDSPDLENHMRLLNEMNRFCTGGRCRHRTLVEYFGQKWERDSCEACDVCSGTMKTLPNARILVQKILSCVIRTGQCFGAGHVSDVLRGSKSARVKELGHDGLSTFGLLSDHPKAALMTWIDQLVDADVLRREGEYPILKVTPKGTQVLRSEAEVTLLCVDVGSLPKKKKRQKKEIKKEAISRAPTQISTLDPGEQRLFEQLRALRRSIADREHCPAFMVFSDKTLRDMARRCPISDGEMLELNGIGKANYARFGASFLELMREVHADE